MNIRARLLAWAAPEVAAAQQEAKRHKRNLIEARLRVAELAGQKRRLENELRQWRIRYPEMAEVVRDAVDYLDSDRVLARVSDR